MRRLGIGIPAPRRGNRASSGDSCEERQSPSPLPRIVPIPEGHQTPLGVGFFPALSSMPAIRDTGWHY